MLFSVGESVQATDGEAALAELRRRGFHLMITDLRMPRLDGMALVRAARAEWPEMEVIVLTAYGTVDGAVEAMKLGALDYLRKPLSGPDEVRLLADRAAERFGLRALRDRASDEGAALAPLSYGSPAMEPVVEALEKVAPTNATVLLLGESGTGKELAAQTLHRKSPRARGPFVPVNCAALSESLLESEIFGHEKGAFTGAAARRRGRLELAEGGTLFLDEVAELKPELQAKLLRVLQDGRFERVGGSQTLEADVRWIAATNRDPEAFVKEGRLRGDLYHRLAVFPIRLPPLRERREDIPALARELLKRIGRDLGRPDLRLDPEAERAAVSASWPGNVRELANALERGAILAGGPVLGPSHLSLSTPARSAEGGTLADLEREAIARALTEVEGNRRRAAERLGIGLRTLYEKLKRYDLG